jgi:DNA-binding beta-propeller fold protein YncE
VTNALDDTVSVINAATCNGTHSAGCDDRLPMIAVGGAPSWPVVDAAQHTVYLVDSADNNVLVLNDRSCDAQTSSGCRHPTGTVLAGTTPSAAAIDERFHTVYVGDSNRFEPPYTISMIDAAAYNVTGKSACTRHPGSLRADGTPFSIAVNQRTNTVYVASSGPLQVINAAQCNGRTSAGCDDKAAVPAGGYAAAVDPSTDTIYVANVHNNGSGYISVIDGRHCHAGDTSGCAGQTFTTTPRVAVGRFPGGVAVDPADHTVYVTNLADGTVSVIDTTHCHAGDTSGCATQSPPTVNLPNANGPIAIAVDPTTNTAYATEGFPFTPGAVALINTTHCHAGDTSQCGSRTPTTIPVPPGPVSVQIDPTTHNVYLADRYDSTVSVIDGLHCNATNTSHCNPIAKIEVGSNPANVTLDLQSQTVYVPNFYDHDASVFAMSNSPFRVK